MATLVQDIEKQLTELKAGVAKKNVGVVREIGDGVAKIEGLTECMGNEMIAFPTDPEGRELYGLALNLEETEVGCILLGEFRHLGLDAGAQPIK